jgi:hypothetical protein
MLPCESRSGPIVEFAFEPPQSADRYLYRSRPEGGQFLGMGAGRSRITQRSEIKNMRKEFAAESRISSPTIRVRRWSFRNAG